MAEDEKPTENADVTQGLLPGDIEGMADDLKMMSAELSHIFPDILDEAQFITADVIKVTGITPKALEQLMNPKRPFFALMGDHLEVKSGKRRMYTGADVIKIRAATVMSSIGLPTRFSGPMMEIFGGRAGLIHLSPEEPEMGLIAYPDIEQNDWRFLTIEGGNQPEEELPFAAIMLSVDELIKDTLRQLREITSEQTDDEI